MEEIDWGSRIPAYAGLALSLWALWRGRTAIKVSMGFRGSEEEIWVANLSSYEVEITSLGAVNYDGTLTDWSDGPDPWPSLPKRIPARSEAVIELHSELAPARLFNRYHYGEGGCFVRIAGGRSFSSMPPVKRIWWRVKSWFKPKPPQSDL